MNKKNDSVTFEQAIARLDEIVKSLEDGKAPLDDLLSVYEEGVSLLRICNSKLDNAELKIKMLSKNPDGTVTETDFKGND